MSEAFTETNHDTCFIPQGISADLIEDVDACAVRSQELAAAAWSGGYFAKSVVPVKERMLVAEAIETVKCFDEGVLRTRAGRQHRLDLRHRLPRRGPVVSSSTSTVTPVAWSDSPPARGNRPSATVTFQPARVAGREGREVRDPPVVPGRVAAPAAGATSQGAQ